MQEATAGDPISGLKWTHKSLKKIAARLTKQGYAISAPTIGRLLRDEDYSLKVNHKRVASKQSAHRDEQFDYIIARRQAFLRRKLPVISVDTKKKELIGNFKQAGREWRRDRREVNLYDFRSDANGIGIPYGIYDVGHNRAAISVGISHDTSEFAVAAIRWWWRSQGCKLYPHAWHLLIEADGGGSNGYRCAVWKARLQDLANEFKLKITVTHFPTGASKWNPIEHRCFSLISQNWAGQPLENYETMLKHIRTTRSETGFRCIARLDQKTYKTKVKVSDQEADDMRIRRHTLFPAWNYTISPRT